MKTPTRRARKVPPTRNLEKAQGELLVDVVEARNLLPLIRKSYVLSQFWAWFCRIQMHPKVRIPLPRALTYRDP